MMTFEETGLNPSILTAIAELGFDTPTPIQEQAIPTILASQQDLVALAQTGTGKTAAFGLPLIHQTDSELKEVQSLILCPTRELCLQISRDLEAYSKHTAGVNVLAVYGGTDISKQIRAIRRGAQIIVGTPGRSLDLIRRGVLKVTGIRQLVLDEADEMLNMGFQQDLDAILAGTPEDKQTLLFSATMPKEISRIAKKYMSDPASIEIGERNSGAKNVEHEFYMVHARDRYEALKRIADMHPDIYGIIFCRTRRETKEVAHKLGKDGYSADAIYGDLTQGQRDDVMYRFRSKEIQLLVATDVAARGIDIDDLTHVINYELPDDLEVYVHRSGRTGRAGKSGISIAIIHTREMRKIFSLERTVGKSFDRKMVPTGREICEKQLFSLVDKMENVSVDNAQIDDYLSVIHQKLESLSREDLIKRFISLEFNRYLDYYKNARDLNVTVADRKSRTPQRRGERRERDRGDRGRSDRRWERGSDRGSERKFERPASRGFERDSTRGPAPERKTPSRHKNGDVDFSRYYINLGNKHGLNPNRLMGLINERLRNRSVPIGKIEVLKKFSFFEIDKRYDAELPDAFKGAVFEETPVVIELSKPESGLTKGPVKQEKLRNLDPDRPKRKRRHKKRD